MLQTHVKSQLEGQGQEYRIAFKDGQRKNRGSTRTLQDRKWLMRDMFLEVVVGLMHC